MRQMQRSVTDSIASNYLNHTVLNTLSNDRSPSSANTQSIYNVNSRYGMNSGDDDVAHIFNRNSLNDCLNLRRSIKDLNNNNSYLSTKNNNSVRNSSIFVNGSSVLPTCLPQIPSTPVLLPSNIEQPKLEDENNQQFNHKRPTCLQLNYFKKETSI